MRVRAATSPRRDSALFGCVVEALLDHATANEDRLLRALDNETLLDWLVEPLQSEASLRRVPRIGVDRQPVCAADHVLHARPFRRVNARIGHALASHGCTR